MKFLIVPIAALLLAGGVSALAAVSVSLLMGRRRDLRSAGIFDPQASAMDDEPAAATKG